QINLLRKEQIELVSQTNKIKKLCAKDAMIKPVILFPDDNVEKILRKLKKEHINACIVVNKDKKFLGEIGDNDIIKLFLQQIEYEPLVKIINRGYRRNFFHKTAKEMINKHKSFVREDTCINKIIKLSWKEGFEYIPVLDKNDKVKGVITPSSIINLLKDY
ncbi:CBS domain-containing protein, partial [Candidatus Woesearchaeota archaeon]|nr:CBS domain-containing protein [Candidatus Woesearchaeota archaeon]